MKYGHLLNFFATSSSNTMNACFPGWFPKAKFGLSRSSVKRRPSRFTRMAPSPNMVGSGLRYVVTKERMNGRSIHAGKASSENRISLVNQGHGGSFKIGRATGRE